MKKYLLAAAMTCAIATPVRDKTTVIKRDENGVRSKTVIHDRD